MAHSIRSSPRPTEVDPVRHIVVYARERCPSPPHVLVTVWTCGLSVEFAWILPEGDNYDAMEHLLMGDIAAVELALQDEWLANERRFAAMRRAAYEKRRMGQ